MSTPWFEFEDVHTFENHEGKTLRRTSTSRGMLPADEAGCIELEMPHMRVPVWSRKFAFPAYNGLYPAHQKWWLLNSSHALQPYSENINRSERWLAIGSMLTICAGSTIPGRLSLSDLACFAQSKQSQYVATSVHQYHDAFSNALRTPAKALESNAREQNRPVNVILPHIWNSLLYDLRIQSIPSSFGHCSYDNDPLSRTHWR